MNQTCSFRGSKSRNKVWKNSLIDDPSNIIIHFIVLVQFTEALAAISKSVKAFLYGAQNDSKEILEIKC